ncbi:hypothetical protein EV421DRAFT_1717575 [Armillaria borealis]|uniref:Uncharacterized protein n=1 Tax=Armillaria borealis TaxID=47425 RepID=A0AA39MHE7_9AGAR|nr:hypothetical protein EV421DRAFT_1717575 [Armillaria borealis]
MSPLAAKVMKRFCAIPPYPRENDFLGPYNKLLHTVFPADSDYTVIPQSYSFLDSYGSANTIIGFEVVFEDNPVFSLQIKEPKSLAVLSAREKADDQMRKRLRDLAPNCPLDTLLHHLPKDTTAFGTCLSFYSYDKQSRVIPKRMLPDREREIDFGPPSRWDCDILEDEGGERFQDIVAEIKAKCDQL